MAIAARTLPIAATVTPGTLARLTALAAATTLTATRNVYYACAVGVLLLIHYKWAALIHGLFRSHLRSISLQARHFYTFYSEKK